MDNLRKWWRKITASVRTKGKKVLDVLPTIFLGVVWYVAIFMLPNHPATTEPLDRLQNDLTSQSISSVELNNDHDKATVELKDGNKYDVVYTDEYGARLLDRLMEARVPVKIIGKGFFERYQWLILGALLIPIIGVYILRAKGQLPTGKKNAKHIAAEERPKERFSDVAGAEEVIDWFRQDVDMLEHPERYAEFGVRPNEGTLLSGPPGTGKTLMARAIAGEAGVSFFPLKGSDFMGRWLHDGPNAVRRAFEEARKHAPAIVFIDEIDSIASRRSDNDDSGSKELNNLLNELLAQLDGFSRSGKPLLVIGATNRPEQLDPAIKRPGRLTRHAHMPAPDLKGRQKILELRARDLKKIADDVDLERLARLTAGMAGAELAGLANQAGLVALGQNNEATEVTMAHFLEALAVAQSGMAQKSRTVLQRDRNLTAIHEAGHTLAALLTEDAPTPHRVTIIPSNNSGGHTGMHDEDWLFLTRSQLKARLVVCMAGRAAEKIELNGEFTTGAESDIAQATKMADYMVGMVGMGTTYTAQVTSKKSRMEEVDTLVKEAEQAAYDLLVNNQEKLNVIRDKLLEVETLDGDQLHTLLNPVTA